MQCLRAAPAVPVCQSSTGCAARRALWCHSSPGCVLQVLKWLGGVLGMFLFVTSEHRDMLSCGRLCGELTACLGALAHFSSGVGSLSTHLPPGERGLGTKVPIPAPVSALLPEHDMVGHLSLLHPSAQGGYCHFGFKIQGHAGASPHGSAPHEGQEPGHSTPSFPPSSQLCLTCSARRRRKARR